MLLLWPHSSALVAYNGDTNVGHGPIQGGGEKNSPRQAKFQPGRGGTSVAVKKKHPKLKKFPVGW